MIERPQFPNDFDFQDHDTSIVAKYLFNETNKTFENVTALPNRQIIKSYRTWNDIAIPLIDYPVLKVYAVSELVKDNQPFSATSLTIAYGLAFTVKQKVPDVSRFVVKELVRNLSNAAFEDAPKFQLDWTNGLRVTYETFLSPENTVYKYATIDAAIMTHLSDTCYV
ncbi:hypothetical protein [Chroococcidiopsis sp.]|uniref:hypothetical protein n=1 Tax=Chroococcidiopsis sp. TaxID=3088168 RepID=UPI003F4147A8